LDVDEVVEMINKEVFHSDWGTFFQIFCKDGMGQKFVEGSQVDLYDVEIQWNEPWRYENYYMVGSRC